MHEDLPPLEEGDIVIKGSYTASNGMEIPVNIHTNKTGLIYQHWRAELERRGGGVQELQEGEIYEIGPLVKTTLPEVTPEKPPTPAKTFLQVFVDEDRRKMQTRLAELRAQLKLATHADPIREEILDLEKRLLGDPVK